MNVAQEVSLPRIEPHDELHRGCKRLSRSWNRWVRLELQRRQCRYPRNASRSAPQIAQCRREECRPFPSHFRQFGLVYATYNAKSSRARASQRHAGFVTHNPLSKYSYKQLFDPVSMSSYYNTLGSVDADHGYSLFMLWPVRKRVSKSTQSRSAPLLAPQSKAPCYLGSIVLCRLCHLVSPRVAPVSRRPEQMWWEWRWCRRWILGMIPDQESRLPHRREKRWGYGGSWESVRERWG